MTRSHEVDAAAVVLSRAAETGASFCAPLVRVLPVEGAAVSTLVSPFEPEVVCSTDPASERLSQWALDLGEGPAWQALASGRPVLVPDLEVARDRWPLLAAAVAESGMRAVYAFPLRVGWIDIGAVDLYSVDRATMAGTDVADAAHLAGIVATQVLQRAMATLGDGGDTAPSSRREVHQATGMLIARFAVEPADALLMLRAHAFFLGRPVLDVASDLVARRIEFPR
jgi:GAF domain-containing protein